MRGVPVAAARCRGSFPTAISAGGQPHERAAGIVTVSDLLELLARKPEHKSNREVRQARGQEDWEAPEE